MTTQMNEFELDVMGAIDECPALVGFRLVCYEVKGGFATLLSMDHFFRCVVAIEDVMWALDYWKSNGVYGGLPVDAPIALVSMKHLVRLAGVIEAVAMSDDMAVAHVVPPMVSMLESDHIANVARLKELTERVSVLETMLAGTKIVSDANEDIISSQESELIRLNALVSVPKKRKAKVSKEEKLALLWLSLPKQAEGLWGISVSKGSKGMIAHTDWRDYWFATLAHAEGFIKAWSIEGERPSLSNLRIGMKPMTGDEDV